MLWKRTLQIFELPATNLLRSETYGLIARFFELFFVSDGQHPVVYLDLRYEEDFFKVLQVDIFVPALLHVILNHYYRVDCVVTTVFIANIQPTC